jgi:hypothetical protein
MPCQYEFYCWGILVVTDATLHWATCWMFCELNPFSFCFTLSIWVLLLRDSCKPMLLCIEHRVGCFVNWIFFSFLFLGHLDGDHSLQMASWLSKFIRVRCRIRWCWMLVNWIFSRSVCVFGSFGDQRLQMAGWPSKASPIWVKCGISMTHSKACKWVVDGYAPQGNKEPIMWRTTCCSYLYRGGWLGCDQANLPMIGWFAQWVEFQKQFTISTVLYLCFKSL